MIVSVKKEIRMQKRTHFACKKGQILDTKWQNNETGEMVWGLWPQRETDPVIFDAY